LGVVVDMKKQELFVNLLYNISVLATAAGMVA